MRFSRQEHWSRLSCPPPAGLPNPGIKPRSPALQVDSLPSEPPEHLLPSPESGNWLLVLWADVLFFQTAEVLYAYFIEEVICYLIFFPSKCMTAQVRGFPDGSAGKESTCDAGRRHWRCTFYPWVGEIPWRRKWQPTPVFLPEKSHGQRSPVGCSSWVTKSQTRPSN